MSIKAKIEKLPFYNDLVLPWHFAQAVAAGMKYKWPAKKLRVIGVTGTNGKTTTSFMIWKMLNEAGYKTGLLTTVGWGGVGDASFGRISSSDSAVRSHGMSNTAPLRASNLPRTASQMTSLQDPDDLDATVLHKQFEHMTTERVEILNRRMRAIADAGAEFMVLEVTSHALAQYRTLGVPIEIAVFTNLTHEHLDYHKTFANYREAKLKLFKQAKYGVVNADDANAKFFEEVYASDDIITYGIKRGDLRATDIKMNATGVEYVVGDISTEVSDEGEASAKGRGRLEIKTQIPGKFNVYNSLAAVAVGRKLGLKNAEIARGIYALESVEGRMNRIRAGQDFEVIVDYAHTPDALEKVFESVVSDAGRARSGGNEADGAGKAGAGVKMTRKVISVHGGAGRRDESTRMIRGEILGKYSDVVIITEDDSRDEDPVQIAEQFVKGAEKAGKQKGDDLIVELDRRKAIERALKMAKKSDLVLILGKGHEKTILRADGAHPFEDIKVVEEVLRGQ